MAFYAHTPPKDSDTWHNLKAHLRKVGARARRYAKAFSGDLLAYSIGIWHDLGKYNKDFQLYLEAQNKGESSSKVPHAIWGAALAYLVIYKRNGDREAWKEMALPIAGHHTGLDDSGTLSQKIETFLQANPNFFRDLPSEYPKPKKINNFHQFDVGSTNREFFIRMCFSALVDADRLDTEGHINRVNRDKSNQRGNWASIEQLWNRFEINQNQLLAKTQNSSSTVNPIRRAVYQACLAAAENPAGQIYRLRVPTGGGKTRSSLAFALKHILSNNTNKIDFHSRLRRVIVAIPYTSIIDQTAQEYRKILDREYHSVPVEDIPRDFASTGRILGDDAVLEHHSQYEPEVNEEQSIEALKARLATENWDAPLIVTTTVQLFESLLGRQPSKVRKLHNIARSVIILDEVQTLPPELLTPTLDVLRSLVEEYGVTLVLSTATQPAFEESRFLKPFQGMTIHEIVEDYPKHFEVLKRVNYHLRNCLTWNNIARELKDQNQALVILNTRKNALAVLDAIDRQEGVYHLSTLLCGANRREILNEIRECLETDRRCILVSTQVVEAGVDLDFPLVYRAIAPLDRIVQAAGRCNRNGKSKKGQVVIFEPDPDEASEPRGHYKVGIETARKILKQCSPEKLHDPDLYRDYFKQFFDLVKMDKGISIQDYRKSLNYPKVAELYRLIDSNTVPVVVNYRDGKKFLQQWLKHPTRQNWRKLQPYIVNLYEHEVRKLMREDYRLEKLTDSLYHWNGYYDERRGIIEGLSDPADLIIS